MAGHSVDQSVQGALQDVGIKLRQDPQNELSCAHVGRVAHLCSFVPTNIFCFFCFQSHLWALVNKRLWVPETGMWSSCNIFRDFTCNLIAAVMFAFGPVWAGIRQNPYCHVDQDYVRHFCARLFNSFLLYDIKQIRIDLGTYRGHFGTLTPFHHACMAQRVEKPLPEPPMLPAPESLRDDGLTSLGFTSMPVRADGTVLSLGCSRLFCRVECEFFEGFILFD